jgi:hypothetical protein
MTAGPRGTRPASATRYPTPGYSLGPSLSDERRAATEVLRTTHRAAAAMRAADRDAALARAADDFGGFDDAWRRYHDAEQEYRRAAARWEDVAAARPAREEGLPFAPPWTTGDFDADLPVTDPTVLLAAGRVLPSFWG